jgi:hypothetical protein
MLVISSKVVCGIQRNVTMLFDQICNFNKSIQGKLKQQQFYN